MTSSAHALPPMYYFTQLLRANFERWAESNPRDGQDYFYDIAVDHLSESERADYRRALAGDGFTVDQVVLDDGTWFRAKYTVAQLARERNEMAAHAPTSSPPVLPAELRALLAEAQASFREWVHTDPPPRIGQGFTCELAVSHLAWSERDVLMAALKADGFATWELRFDTNPPRIVIAVECVLGTKEQQERSAALHAPPVLFDGSGIPDEAIPRLLRPRAPPSE